jgi:hypothetical protein
VQPRVAHQTSNGENRDGGTYDGAALAESIGTREAWHFFLSTYPDGFNAKLALTSAQACRRGTRGMAAEKVPLASEAQTRAAVESAKASEQVKAAAQANAAEQARITLASTIASTLRCIRFWLVDAHEGD